MKKELVETKEEVKICDGCLNSDHCRNCLYLDTSKPWGPGSSLYKCIKRGSYHKGDECACSSFVRG